MALIPELLTIATTAAEATVDLLLDRVDGSVEVNEKSSTTDLVTEVDREAEALIVGIVTSNRPDDGIVGEEGTGIEGTTSVRWIIDPIDGTTNFVYGHPGFSVSIAVEIDGELAVGVVGDPLHRDTFTATKGEGAFRNGRPIGVSGATELSRSLVATGFGYDREWRMAQGAVVTQLLGEVADIRRMGSAAVDLCSVACGRVDAYFERGLNIWDFAAGSLIASEAGAIVHDLHGGPPTKRFTFASSPGIASPLADLLTRLGADQI